MTHAHVQWQSYVLLLCVVSLCTAANARAGENYLLFPVTTELQRKLVSHNVSAEAFVAIYANGVIKNGRVNADLLNLKELRADLKKLAARREGAAYVALRYENWTPMPKAEDELEQTMRRLCQEAGFKRTWIGTMHTEPGWREVKRALKAEPDVPGAEEGSDGDQGVRVYPVRTSLSRYLTNGADCVVEVRQPFDGRHAELPPGVKRSIPELVDKLALQRKERIQFHVSSTKAGELDVMKFSSVGTALLAREIGFESASVVHSPNGGAPESLLGKSAPGFTLDGLDGKPITLADQIRGRAAIITFWGLACGPCRQEAPHLSAAFEEYKDKGLSVIAINAYDDDKEAVADYVQKEQLRHPIALKGGRVAREYAVGAFPTAFWVDHRGKVVDYVVGFYPGNESQITLRIERLLKERNASAR